MSEIDLSLEVKRIAEDNFNEESILVSNNLKNHLNRLSLYINPEKMSILLKYMDTTRDNTIIERNVLKMQLVKLQAEADYLAKRLYTLFHYSDYSIDQNKMNEFENKFKDMIIRTDMLDFFNTPEFLKMIEPLNTQVSNALNRIGKLKKEKENG